VSDAPEKPPGPPDAPGSTAPATPATPGTPETPETPTLDAAAEAAAKAQAEAEAKAQAAAAAKTKAEAAAKAKAAHEAAEAAKPVWERDPVTPAWTDAASDPLVEALRGRHGDAVVSARSIAGELTLQVRCDAIADVCASLKRDHGYTYLIDLCGADYPKRTLRFEVVYHLHCFRPQRRVRLKVSTDEATAVPTVCGVWKAANWEGREVYDMYGVRFDGHPDLTRILLWEGFNGYPLRKDFPLMSREAKPWPGAVEGEEEEEE